MTFGKRSNDGYMYRYNITDDGNSFSQRQIQRFAGYLRGGTDIIQGPGNIVITAERGRADKNATDGSIIRTFVVPNGDHSYEYTNFSIADQQNVLIDANGKPLSNSTYGDYNSLAQLNDSTYVLAYMGESYNGYIATFKVKIDGLITVLKQYEHDVANGRHNSLVSVSGNTVALAYTGVGGSGYVKTFTIPDDGSTIIEKKKVPLKETENGGAAYFSFTKVNETVYALAYQGKGADGYISTIKISLDGETVEEKKTVKHDPNQNSWNSLIQIRPNTVMLACSGVGDDGYIKTFTIAADGSDITPVISLEHNRDKALYNDLTQIDSDTYLLTYYNQNNYGGTYRTFTS